MFGLRAILESMIELIKNSAAVLAIGIALIAYIPYLIDMFRGKNKPHLYTWISIFLITVVVAWIQVIGGAGVGALPTIIGAAVNGVILFYCFKYGTKDIAPIDRLCLAISILGIVAYVLLQGQPVIALAVVTVAEVVSFVPTFRKTRNDPYSESLTSYYLLMLKLALILVALESYNLLTVSYSALWLAVFSVFLIAVYVWRSRMSRKQRNAKN